MATIECARSLGLDKEVGSLEKGKKADIIILGLNKPHLIPLYNPYSHAVYAARGNDVTHTIINGRMVMKERRLMTLDLGEIFDRVNVQAARVKSWLAEV
jgi:5-methylthioadenosine/S-adenosylhomocysteine deaminase